MKYALLSALVLLGGAFLLGPLSDSIGAPAGVVQILDDVKGIF